MKFTEVHFFFFFFGVKWDSMGSMWFVGFCLGLFGFSEVQ